MLRLFSFILLAIAINANASPLFSGYSQEDITPTKEEGAASCLGGYGQPFSRCGVTEATSKITTSALSFTKEKNTVILVSVDTVGLGDSVLSEVIATAVAQSQNKIKPESILISATHTHSGPDFQGLWGGVAKPYKQRAIQLMAKSIVDAYNNQKPAFIYVWDAKSKVENRRGWNIVDDNISIIDVRAFGNSKRIATLVNMSAHPTIIDADNKTWNADYVGSLRDSLNSSLHTNTIFINGIVGDAQPATNGERGIARAVQFGNDTASSINWKARTGRVLEASEINYTQKSFDQQVDNKPLLGAVKVGLLDLFVNPNLTVTTQLGVLSIGCDFKAIVFPGEALSRLGIPMKDSLKSKYKMFFGLTTDSLGYFIPQDEFGVIQNRTTEEQASLSPTAGNNASQILPDVDTFDCDRCDHHGHGSH